MILKTLLLALLTCGAIYAQLESAIITGTTAPAAAKAGQTAVKGINTSLGKTGTALRGAARTSQSSRVQAARPVVAKRATGLQQSVNSQVADTKSDFPVDALKIGMSRGELMALAGKPYSKITIPIDGGSSERFSYQMKAGGALRVVLEREKIVEIKSLEQ
jgi:hypothetical protein